MAKLTKQRFPRSLDRLSDLLMLMGRPLESMRPIDTSDIAGAAAGADLWTIHSFNLHHQKTVARTLKDFLFEWQRQIYLFLKEEDSQYLYTIGGSLQREEHNRMIDYFLHHLKDRKRANTVVLVSKKAERLAYLYRRGYAYVKFNIGANYDPGIIRRLERSDMPFTVFQLGDGLERIAYHEGNSEIEVYRGILSDFGEQQFQEQTRKIREKVKEN